jgi:hypothetical protein
VWYDWLRGVRTTKSCATAVQVARTRNVVQPGVPKVRLATNGADAVAAAAMTPPT